MSPRRLIDSGVDNSLRMPDPQPVRRGLPWVAGIAAVVVALALAMSVWVFADRQVEHRAEIREAAVLSFVSSFITQYTSPDPFNANDYADKVLAMGTGNFATLYSEMMNVVVIQVAQSEPGSGAVQELGIQQWNPDGSATVLAVTNMTTKLPDGTKIESGNRWEITAIEEGEQWKVSDLIQVV